MPTAWPQKFFQFVCVIETEQILQPPVEVYVVWTPLFDTNSRWGKLSASWLMTPKRRWGTLQLRMVAFRALNLARYCSRLWSMDFNDVVVVVEEVVEPGIHIEDKLSIVSCGSNFHDPVVHHKTPYPSPPNNVSPKTSWTPYWNRWRNGIDQS